MSKPIDIDHFNSVTVPIADHHEWDEGMTLWKQVADLENQRDKLKSLCGEILATILLDGNKHLFQYAPPIWHELVARWEEEFKRINKSE